METVTVSPTFQEVIPRKVSEALDIRPGQKVADGLPRGFRARTPPPNNNSVTVRQNLG
jgi:hypothetical protein